jgi:TPR repeat protein
MVLLGHAYERGQGLEIDYAKAREFYQRAATSGDAAGQYYYVMSAARKDGREWLLPNELAWMSTSAKAGFAAAQFWMGTNYERGINDKKNLNQAAWWYEKAALNGYAFAQYNLALMYHSGSLDYPKDEAEAAHWFKEAALQDDAAAQYYFAEALWRGAGVQKDADTARGWYLKAAQAGNVTAMVALAQVGVESERLSWLRKAAVLGNMDAQLSLGNSYKEGRGVPRDFEEARRWYTLAASQGLVNAQLELKNLDAFIAYVAKEERRRKLELERLAAEERRERLQELEQERRANADAERRDIEATRAFWRGLGQSFQEAGRMIAVKQRQQPSSTYFIPSDSDSDNSHSNAESNASSTTAGTKSSAAASASTTSSGVASASARKDSAAQTHGSAVIPTKADSISPVKSDSKSSAKASISTSTPTASSAASARKGNSTQPRDLGAILTRTDNGDAEFHRQQAQAVADAEVRDQQARAAARAEEAKHVAEAQAKQAAMPLNKCVKGEHCDVAR